MFKAQKTWSIIVMDSKTGNGEYIYILEKKKN